MQTSVRWRRRAATLLAALVVASVPVIAGTAGAAEPIHYYQTPVAAWRADGVGWATLVVGNVAYVGGDFPTVRSNNGATVVTRSNLAAFDLTTGALITTFTANTNGVVRALATDGQRLYVGGLFTSVNGVTRRRVAAVSLTTGAVDSNWSADASSNVFALAVGGGKLFLGGTFSTVRSVARTRIAAVSLTDGALDPFAPALDTTVDALAVTADGQKVFLGGDFLTVNGTSRTS